MGDKLPVAGKVLVPMQGRRGHWHHIFPGLHALVTHDARQWRYDLVAAITLAAYLVPAGMGDASLAGLPPEAGLYACLFSGLLFWLFCSARYTAVTVTSAISLLVGASLGDMAGGDTSRYWALASCTALMAGGLALTAWIGRAGVLVNFISETVMVGFKIGVALLLISTQLPKLFGFKGTHGDFWERIWYFLSHLGNTNKVALALGGSALAVLLAGKVFLKNKPVSLFVVIIAIAIVSLAHLGGHGVKLLGELPQGLPALTIPAVSWRDVNDLLPLAMACFLLGAVETVAIGRTFALKHGFHLDANQEFLALAAANVASGLGAGYPVSGGMSQSLVNESAGARSPVSGLLAAGIVLLVVVLLSGLLRNLPEAVLAAIVLSAVTGLINVAVLKRLWRFNRSECGIAVVVLLGVLGEGLLRGVLIGAVISILVLLRRGARPHTTELGKVPGTNYFADLIRHEGNVRVPGVFVFRTDSSLLYFNVDFIRDRFLQLLGQRTDPVYLTVFYLGTVPAIDLAGADLLRELHEAMQARGLAFCLAETHGNVRDALRRAGFEEHCTRVEANQTVSQVVANCKHPA